MGLVGVALCWLAGCGGEKEPSQSGDASVEEVSGPVADGAAEDASGIAEGPGVPELGERGWMEARVIAHLHSAYSHDACDELGLDDGGAPNWSCVQNMKDALCAEGIDVAFMTDHPSFLRDQPFEDLLYGDSNVGDLIHRDEAGEAWGVTYSCPEGQGGLDGQVRLLVGFEGTHTMPLGIRRHFSDTELYGTSFRTETPSEDLSTLTGAVRAAGGMVAIAHSEEADLDWTVIAEHDVSAMEVYNFHANFIELFESGQLEKIFELDPFVGTLGDPADPDLAAIMMLGTYPIAALEKWRRVSSERSITPIAGSDVHENVILPGLCAFDLCAEMADEYPNMVQALSSEGPLMMPDGERLDSYGRVFRWVQNHPRIAADLDPVKAVEAALEEGRNIVVFEIFGSAAGVELIALEGEQVLEMGSEVSVESGAMLWARSPSAPIPGRLASWKDGSPAVITGTIVRSHGGTSEVVATAQGPGAWMQAPLNAPGAYHLEVFIQPLHLVDALGSASLYAQETYRWVETGAIRVTDP